MQKLLKFLGHPVVVGVAELLILAAEVARLLLDDEDDAGQGPFQNLERLLNTSG